MQQLLALTQPHIDWLRNTLAISRTALQDLQDRVDTLEPSDLPTLQERSSHI